MSRAKTWLLCFLFGWSGTLVGGELVTLELPGFSINVPDADVGRPADAASSGSLILLLTKPQSYDAFGKAVLTKQLVPAASRQLVVQWVTVSMSPEDLRRKFIEGVSTGIPGGEARVLRDEEFAPGRRAYLIGNDANFVAAGVVACSESFYVSVIMGLVTDREAMLGILSRVAASVVCKPMDPKLGETLPALRLPENFGRRNDPGALMYLSTDGEMLHISMVPKDLQASPVVLQALVSQIATMFNIDPAGANLTLVDANPLPGRRAQLSHLANKSGMNNVYVGLLYCLERDITIVSTWYKGNGAIDTARERIRRVGCPGEPSKPVRSMKDVFTEACKAGKQMACSGLQAFPQ